MEKAVVVTVVQRAAVTVQTRSNTLTQEYKKKDKPITTKQTTGHDFSGPVVCFPVEIANLCERLLSHGAIVAREYGFLKYLYKSSCILQLCIL